MGGQDISAEMIFCSTWLEPLFLFSVLPCWFGRFQTQKCQRVEPEGNGNYGQIGAFHSWVKIKMLRDASLQPNIVTITTGLVAPGSR